MEIGNLLEIHTRADTYRWFIKNHATMKEFWIRSNRSKTPVNDAIGYADAVEVALCFGWIDSTQKRIDYGKPVQRFSHRRKGSNWCDINVARCHRLIQTGEMTDAGIAVMPPEVRRMGGYSK